MNTLKPKFNTDIGADQKVDQPYFKSQFPLVSEFLVWPELIRAFQTPEAEAIKLKQKVRKNGVRAILFALTGLIVATAKTVFDFSPLSTDGMDFDDIASVISLILLVIAVFFGKGILFGKNRDVWLRNRLRAERLRQFHFQFIMLNSRAVATRSYAVRRELLEARQKQLEKTIKRLNENGYKQSVLDDAELSECFLAERVSGIQEDADTEAFEQLKKALTELRFEHQRGYALHQLEKSGSGLSLRGSIADRARGVNNLEFIATLLLLSLQLLAVLLTIVMAQDAPFSQTFAFAASVAAIIVVALKSYEEGLHLPQDLARNRIYAAGCSKLQKEFQAPSITDSEQALDDVLRRMEELAYFETREFVIAHSESRFSL
ncbi:MULTISPECIES: hypothetical protein [unclassified Ruegeria]|uniref:hypothetical protein n=1 Tax=unclassified Ruegeria TaxID=2625375 RepID=UPI001489A2AA|nr:MULTISPECIES: hypothetical protein [unclassified Ruegeria]NOD75833.1 hypothetical protein [Ruegeria sp. HKCCD4332]